jgi:hypothetical protein
MRNEGQDCDYDKQEIKDYTESNKWVSNAPIYYFLRSVLSSVCRSHNIVLRSSFITHPSITFCVMFYLLIVDVTILSFVPHSLLNCDYDKQKIKHYTESNRWVSNE